MLLGFGCRTNSSSGLERQHLQKKSTQGVDKDKLKPADPEPDSDHEDDGKEEEKYTIDSLQDTPDFDYDDNVANGQFDEPFEDSVTGWKDDELSIAFTDLLLQETQRTYEKAYSIISPKDPRISRRHYGLSCARF